MEGSVYAEMTRLPKHSAARLGEVNGAVMEGADLRHEEVSSGRAAARVLIIVAVLASVLSLWAWSNDRDPASPTVAMDTDLMMTSQQDAARILSYGFDAPESDGTWIVAHHARILFEVDSGSPQRVTLNFYPFLSGEVTTRQLEVRSSADVLSVSLVDGINTVAVALDGDREQAVDINCFTVDSPLNLGVGSDQRTLCAKLIDVRIGSG